jgi:hypothetical protein
MGQRVVITGIDRQDTIRVVRHRPVDDRGFEVDTADEGRVEYTDRMRFGDIDRLVPGQKLDLEDLPPESPRPRDADAGHPDNDETLNLSAPTPTPARPTQTSAPVFGQTSAAPTARPAVTQMPARPVTQPPRQT